MTARRTAEARRAAETAAVLRRFLAALDAGELVAPAAVRYRIEGAVIALDAVAGGRALGPDALGGPPPSRPP
jgi:hypothetical protein